jgi:hypothetical protein
LLYFIYFCCSTLLSLYVLLIFAQRERIEYSLLSVVPNNMSWVLQTINTSKKKRKTALKNGMKGCADLALLDNKTMEGPLLVSCRSRKKPHGFVTKCCPKGQALNQDMKHCVDIPKQVSVFKVCIFRKNQKRLKITSVLTCVINNNLYTRLTVAMSCQLRGKLGLNFRPKKNAMLHAGLRP